MKHLACFLLSLAPLVAQTNATVAISQGNPDTSFARVQFYDGSNNLIYQCLAPKQNLPFTWSVTAAQGTNRSTLTSIVVLTNVGTVTTGNNHGLQIGNLVTVAGSTTAALNGNYYVQTTPSATTFTITTSGVADATYNNAAMAMTSTAPLTSQPVWSIFKFTYSSSNLVNIQMSTKFTSGSSATPAYVFICDNRAATTGATAIAYQ